MESGHPRSRVHLFGPQRPVTVASHQPSGQATVAAHVRRPRPRQQQQQQQQRRHLSQEFNVGLCRGFGSEEGLHSHRLLQGKHRGHQIHHPEARRSDQEHPQGIETGAHLFDMNSALLTRLTNICCD